MPGLSRLGALLSAGLLLAIPLYAQNPRVRQVSAVSAGEAIEVEIQITGMVVPQSQAITGPDRIVVDFPGALPAAELHGVKFNRGALKGIRTGLFSANPPITRVVLDLDTPQPYQVFATGSRVVLKLASASANLSSGLPTAVPASFPMQQEAALPRENAARPPAGMQVNFKNGLLRIYTEKATLAQVLYEVQRLTGAEIPIPAGAEQEEVAADLGPAPPRDVLAALLNGSRYNFIFVGNDRNRNLQKAILSVR